MNLGLLFILFYLLYVCVYVLFSCSDRIVMSQLFICHTSLNLSICVGGFFVFVFVFCFLFCFFTVPKMTAFSILMIKCKCVFVLFFLIMILTEMYSLWRTVRAPLVGGCEFITAGEVLVHVICLWALAFNCLKWSKHLGFVEPFFFSFLLCSLIRPAIHFHVVRSP